MVPNDLVWSSLALTQLDAALRGRAPAEAAQLVERLENLPLRTGWGRPDGDEVMVLYCPGFRVTYQLVVPERR
ncbi:hypothetical protein EV643_108317 [Kribbella sp. VKM Ac-2527]|jgi:hypothetical protein|uniref:ParE-like toxin of type II ParDE toxin-antitoxin system n=1 Tax=Kribbella caucasensis TaxID=2512215 RepID=A0A4R6KFH1_9ACTN|nr:hypothetical protein [Kribbella sp. VKM Ac-2527]TDO48000.1 hypothetical protein EV643_108317 [Kribbella sp. VKM Ac-2527]